MQVRGIGLVVPYVLTQLGHLSIAHPGEGIVHPPGDVRLYHRIPQELQVLVVGAGVLVRITGGGERLT